MLCFWCEDYIWLSFNYFRKGAVKKKSICEKLKVPYIKIQKLIWVDKNVDCRCANFVSLDILLNFKRLLVFFLWRIQSYLHNSTFTVVPTHYIGRILKQKQTKKHLFVIIFMYITFESYIICFTHQIYWLD